MDCISREVGRLGKIVDDDDKKLAILNGYSPKYEVKRGMLEGSEDLTRACIEEVFTNQYDRIQEAKQEAGAKVLAIVAKGPTAECKWCDKPGYIIDECKSLPWLRQQ